MDSLWMTHICIGHQFYSDLIVESKVTVIKLGLLGR